MSYSFVGSSNTQAAQSPYSSQDTSSFSETELSMMHELEQKLFQQIEQQEEHSGGSSDSESESGESCFSEPETPSSMTSGTTTPGYSTSGAPPKGQTASSSTGASPAESSDEQYARVATVLGRHEGLIKGSMDRKSLEKLANDKDTPDDEKQAINELLNNPSLYARFDSAKTGKADGKISKHDIEDVQKDPTVQLYAKQQAEAGTHNYVASDSENSSQSTEMTSNDAMRELFRYSQSLPKHIDTNTLQAIANGTQNMDKCPPQVAAAAQYYLDHPDQWKQLTGNDSGKVSRDKLCDQATHQIELRPDEEKAVQTVNANQDIFFKKKMTQKNLQDIANDPKNSQDVRDAAKLLSQPNSTVFEMLDNAKHGAGGNAWNVSNDGNVSKGDLSAFIKKGTNQVESAPVATSAYDANATAQSDMLMGMQTAPDKKKEEGGEAKKALEILGMILGGAVLTVAGGAGIAAIAGEIGAAVGVGAGAATATAEAAADTAGVATATATEAATTTATTTAATTGETVASTTGEAVATTTGETAGTTAGSATSTAAESTGEATGEAAGNSAVDAGETAAEQTGSWTSRASDAFNSAKQQAQDSIGSFRQQIEDTIGRYSSDASGAFKEDVQQQINNLMDKINAYRENPAEALKGDAQDAMSPGNLGMKGLEHTGDMTSNNQSGNQQSSGVQGNGWGYNG